jgi:acetyl esterase/lipase
VKRAETIMGDMMAYEERLDPELAAGLAKFPPLPDFSDIPAGRRAIRELMEKYPRTPDTRGVKITDRVVPGPAGGPDVRLRMYRPAGQCGSKLAGLYYMHGGGYIIGTPDQEDDAMCHIVREVGCLIASVDYRLAPEHKAPAAVEDAYAGLKWMAANADEIGLDAGRLAIGGRSAGGGLAASLALLTRDRGEIKPVFQLLIYPMIDDRTRPAGAAITDARVWNHGHNDRAWTAYLDGAPGGARTSPYAAASRAENLAGLPPAYIAVGDAEVFLQENIDYAERLRRAGVPAELHVFPGAFHGWESMLPAASISQRAIAERVAVLKRALHG